MPVIMIGGDVMEKKKSSGENSAQLVWFNGMEIESVRYAINSYIDYADKIYSDKNDKYENPAFDDAIEAEKIQLEQIEDKFIHKIKNFEAYDGLKINLTVNEINKIKMVITEEIDRERERNNALMKELLLIKKGTEEYAEKEQKYSIMTYYYNQLIDINKKLSNSFL